MWGDGFKRKLKKHNQNANGRFEYGWVKTKVGTVVCGLMICVVLAYFFYRSIWVLPFLTPVLVWFIRMKNREAKAERKWELSLQFKEAIGFVNSSLRAGYSMENAFCNTYPELCVMFGKEADITKEWYILTRGLESNRALDELLVSFGERSEVADIRDFAEVFTLVKRNGGDFNKMIDAYSQSISGKLEVLREIRVAISEKQFEFRIMSAMPFFILLYIDFTSQGFFNPLYHNVFGVSVMTICLVTYLFAVWLGQRIMQTNLA